jgi:hypothetical protein
MSKGITIDTSDATSVRLTGAIVLHCPNCGTIAPLDKFGFRRDGSTIMNQSWCSSCRSKGCGERQPIRRGLSR